MIEKVLSGGQTGVDRAALDSCLQHHIPCGGWCPLNRRAEDGPIPDRYPLLEAPSTLYQVRTRYNIRDSSGTLLIHGGKLDKGSMLTVNLAIRMGKPLLQVDLNKHANVEEAAAWIRRNHLIVLNVAGPRESFYPGIYRQALEFMNKLVNYLIN